MNFKELLTKTDWFGILQSLIKHYDISEERKSNYKKMYFKLLSQSPEENVDNTTIRINTFKEDEKTLFDVCGTDDTNPDYSLEYCSSNEWLGFNVQLDEMKDSDFISHCLMEMPSNERRN